MNNRKNLLIIIFTIFVVTALTIIILKPKAQILAQKQEQQDVATVVKRGQVTEKERELSKEYRKLYAYRKARTFTYLLNKGIALGKTDGDITVSMGEPEYVDISPEKKSTARFLKNLSCSADTVVVGTIQNKISHMTDDETTIYTEYTFSVGAVLKNNSASPIKINNPIVITRPGGLIQLDGRRIRFVDKEYEPLQTARSYILFLRFVPTADSYINANSDGDFAFENNSFRSLSKAPLPDELRNGSNLSALLTDISNSIATNCSEGDK